MAMLRMSRWRFWNGRSNSLPKVAWWLCWSRQNSPAQATLPARDTRSRVRRRSTMSLTLPVTPMRSSRRRFIPSWWSRASSCLARRTESVLHWEPQRPTRLEHQLLKTAFGGSGPWILVGDELRELVGQLTADHLRLDHII